MRNKIAALQQILVSIVVKLVRAMNGHQPRVSQKSDRAAFSALLTPSIGTYAVYH
jgi:hypothetical protein